MYGLIGKIKSIAGQRDALVAILLDGLVDMPGCLSYIVAADPTDPDAIWVTEVWASREHHVLIGGEPLPALVALAPSPDRVARIPGVDDAMR